MRTCSLCKFNCLLLKKLKQNSIWTLSNRIYIYWFSFIQLQIFFKWPFKSWHFICMFVSMFLHFLLSSHPKLGFRVGSGLLCWLDALDSWGGLFFSHVCFCQNHTALNFGLHDDAIQMFWSGSGHFWCLHSRQAISVLCNLHILASITSLLFAWSFPDNEECFSLIASFCVCTTERRIQLHDRRDLPTHSLT